MANRTKKTTIYTLTIIDGFERLKEQIEVYRWEDVAEFINKFNPAEYKDCYVSFAWEEENLRTNRIRLRKARLYTPQTLSSILEQFK